METRRKGRDGKAKVGNHDPCLAQGEGLELSREPTGPRLAEHNKTSGRNAPRSRLLDRKRREARSPTQHTTDRLTSSGRARAATRLLELVAAGSAKRERERERERERARRAD